MKHGDHSAPTSSLPLFADARARRTDPKTSQRAAASVQRVRDNQQAVLKILEIYGPLTDEQLVGLYGRASQNNEHRFPKQSPSGLRTRRHELVELGKVRDSSKREKLASGRWAMQITRADWETPQWLFDQYHAQFRFTLDVCATAENAKCPRFFTPEVNGLEQDWGTNVCWMNPPYGRVTAFFSHRS
jgi:hypothetical protein